MFQLFCLTKKYQQRQPETLNSRFQAAFLRLNHIRKQSNLRQASCLYYRAFSRRKARANGLVGG
ncbi:hypothetical protein GCWU000324_02704 [Kingella oralis ATCC 51147]|uniref:Uncharacterized protein n=1 Tax=Kingella oralis ATCC 51147 TaxID=629741 RepID=C4GLY0_9NEIS|nr:hypothetical protein GCWU000324_02704 [Kingella oralis ATCC 51147]